MKRTATTITALCIILLSTILPARAQNSTGALNLTTSPLPVSLKAKPGETVSTELRVRNSGNQTETLKVGLMKFSAYGEEGKPKLEDRAPGDNYFDWVSFSETKFVAEPNEWNDIEMTIKVPASAAFGYYYAVTFSRADPSSSRADSTTAVEGATATLVLLDVDSKDANPQLELESFTTDKKSYEFLPTTFTIKVKNTGNIHLAPLGTIFIKQGSKSVAHIPVNDTAGTILPGSSRTFTSRWTDGFPAYELKEENGQAVYKEGKPVYQLGWKVDKFKNIRIGRYTAQLTMAYDDGQRDVPLEASVSFWVIPWRLIALFIGLPLLIIGMIVYLVLSKRKYKKKSVYRH